jgi:glycosyltransferase involved in cell wall biosynthesis
MKEGEAKIISIIENMDDNYGGPSVSLPGLIKALQKNFHIPVKIISVRLNDREFNSSLQSSNVEWDNSCKKFGPRKIMFSFKFYKVLQNNISGNDLVYINNLWNYVAFCAFWVAKKKGAKIVFSPRGSLYEWSLKQRGVLKKIASLVFQKRFMAKSDMVHVTSESEFEAVQRYGVDKNKIVLIPHGVDLPAETGFTLVKRDRIVKGLELPKKYFLFMSRLHKKKGLDVLIEMWGGLRHEYPDWELVVAGPDYGQYQGSDILSTVLYLGSVSGDDKNKVLENCEFLVLPSYSENFGVVIAEAMAFSKPVITSSNTPWEELNDKCAGRCVDLNDFESALKEFLELDESEMAKMGSNARKIIQDKYSWGLRSKEFFEKVYLPLTRD